MGKRFKPQVDAVRSITSDPTAMRLLSPPSRVLLTTIESSLETAIGKSLASVSDDVASGVSESTGSMVAGTIADVIETVPLVGTAIGFIIKFFAAIFGSDSGAQTEYCNRFLGHFKPVPTGSMLGGGTTVPADLFAAHFTIPKHGYWERSSSLGNVFVTGIPVYASALGSALMALVEGMPADTLDAGSSGLTPDGKELHGKEHVQAFLRGLLPHVVKSTDAAWLKDHKGPVGVHPKRSEQFRALRRAIRASWGPGLHKGAKSDGGLALWPIYLDLLVGESARLQRGYTVHALVERGKAYLPNGGQGTGLHHDPRFEDGMFGDDDRHFAPGDPDRGCASILTDQIESMISGWRNTVKPYYSQGHAKIAELQAQAKQIARDHAAKKAPQTAEIAQDDDA